MIYMNHTSSTHIMCPSMFVTKPQLYIADKEDYTTKEIVIVWKDDIITLICH